MRLARVSRQRWVRVALHTMVATTVSAFIVAPSTVAWADTATDPSSTTTTPPDPVTPETTTTTTAPTTTTTDTTNPATTTAPAPPVTDPPTPTADDGDGIAATIEDAAPHGGDGNRDGLVDSRQSNVASLPAAVDVNGDGALDDYVTIVAPAGTTLTNVRARRVPGGTPPPDGVSLPYGLFEYDVTVANPGDTAEITYVLPDADAAPTSVHMLQNGVWTDYADHTSVDAVGGKVTVALRDGGEGDETGTTDGVITHQSGPSTPPTTSAPVPPTADDGDGIAATIEDAAPNGGDGNGDGLVDSRQSNVASLPAAVDVNGNGALDDYVTIVAPEGTTLTNVRALQVPSDNPPPDGVNLPYGLFEYDVTVANPGDTAEVTYVLPDEGVVPTSVHMLQNGVWTDYADHTSVDAVDGKVTVALRDGGEGDETGTTDGVIEDPSGPSTSNQTITVTNVSGASAPNFTFRLERCSETTGSNCTGATPVGTASGSNNASGDSGALANGSSWFWGSPTALEYDRNYRLSVITPLPASGWRSDRPQLRSGRKLDGDRRCDRDDHPLDRLGLTTDAPHAPSRSRSAVGRSPRTRVVCATPPPTTPTPSPPGSRARRSSTAQRRLLRSPSPTCV